MPFHQVLSVTRVIFHAAITLTRPVVSETDWETVQDHPQTASGGLVHRQGKKLLFRRLGRLSAPAVDALVGLADAIVEMLDSR